MRKISALHKQIFNYSPKTTSVVPVAHGWKNHSQNFHQLSNNFSGYVTELFDLCSVESSFPASP